MNCIGINQFDGEYIIGAGKGDTTGPVAGVNMMGYAMPSQIASGLHGRLYARNRLICSKLQKSCDTEVRDLCGTDFNFMQ